MNSRRPTEKQNAARSRNWRIRCLRALWAQAGQLTGLRLDAVRSLIDVEIAELGAEPQGLRVAREITETDISF